MAEAVKTELTLKQKRFIDAYLGETKGNATKAARIAGYAGTPDSLRVTGHDLLTNPNVSRVIKQYLAECALPLEEVLSRLTEHSKSSIEPFVSQHGSEIYFDINSEEARASLHLVKRIKTKRKSGGSGEKAWSESEVEFEMYDAQAALRDLGRYHKLFTDKQEVSGDPNAPVVVKVLKNVSMSSLRDP